MLDIKYNPKEIEKDKYSAWLKQDLFRSGAKEKQPFSIVIPPPNVTGKLHLGHAWNGTLQDAIIRYKHMQGFDTLWLPGMDHAGIATQAKIDAKLKANGINPRELSKEEWLKYAWSWKEEYASTIRSQWAKLGLALDYSKESFTMDDNLSRAVNKVFVDLYNEGLIYRGERIINWDPQAMTALSNEEVIYKEVKAKFYYLKYFIEDSEKYLEIATTRPETLFGDTAVAVNESDARYRNLIGKNVILPLVGKKIPIIGDVHADPEFGTGVVKITPAHDPNDFEVGERHNLSKVICINLDGTMNENALEFQGLDRVEAREKVVEKLRQENILIKEENITHSVGHSERTGVMVEPILSKQWFVKMRPLADEVLSNQKDKEEKITFFPKRYEKIMNHWMEISHDWCISRQLWWGHQIPVWYKEEEIYCGLEAPKGEGWVRETDVLDTWFSSALWPFSTLGWPNDTDDLNRYYPNSVLVTAYDIIFFWVCRMAFSGLHHLNKRPFKDCLIHGIIRDPLGKKMSKSAGNGIDPMDVINENGADALRWFLATSSANGTDLRYDEAKVKSSWNFINKIWNASRFVLMNVEEVDVDFNINELKIEDKWILSKLNKTIKNVTKYMEKYEFNTVGSLLYNFIWTDFCDAYIEMAKTSLDNQTTKKVLKYVLTCIIKMLHPLMPFVTDEIYSKIDKESIFNSTYPVYDKKLSFADAEKEITEVIDFISKFRNTIKENNVSKNYYIKLNNDKNYDLILKVLRNIDKQEVINEYQDKLEVISENYNITIYYHKEIEIVDNSAEIERLKQSIAKRKSLLNGPFATKAPANLVEEEKEKLASEENLLKKLV